MVRVRRTHGVPGVSLGGLRVWRRLTWSHKGRRARSDDPTAGVLSSERRRLRSPGCRPRSAARGDSISLSRKRGSSAGSFVGSEPCPRRNRIRLRWQAFHPSVEVPIDVPVGTCRGQRGSDQVVLLAYRGSPTGINLEIDGLEIHPCWRPRRGSTVSANISDTPQGCPSPSWTTFSAGSDHQA